MANVDQNKLYMASVMSKHVLTNVTKLVLCKIFKILSGMYGTVCDVSLLCSAPNGCCDALNANNWSGMPDCKVIPQHHEYGMKFNTVNLCSISFTLSKRCLKQEPPDA